MKDKQGGFTLIEAMVTLVLAGILLAIGAPSFAQFIRNSRMTSASNDLLAAMHAARTEAIKRRVPVTVCASADPTSSTPTCDDVGDFGGWILFVDDDGDPDVASGDEGNGTYESGSGERLLRASGEPAAGLTFAPSTVYVQFGPNGFQRRALDAAPDDVAIRICDLRGNTSVGSSGSAARALLVTRTGRPEITRSVSTITALGDCPTDD